MTYGKGRRVRLGTILLLFMSFLVLAPAAQAAIIYLDDFEDGDHDGWLVTTTGGSGGTNVVDHNDSLMAHVYHSGTYTHFLSHDLRYEPTDTLSFDMHAVAVQGGQGADASAGFRISFLDSFNQTLGSARLVRATDPSWVGSNGIPVDSVQHQYENLVSDYLPLAGLDASAPIDGISLTFFANGQNNFYGNATANVWFDNVTLDAVPLPPAVLLLGSGLIGLVGFMRRKS